MCTDDIIVNTTSPYTIEVIITEESGPAGKSAYEIWLDNGNEGTEQDFLDSLKGDTWQKATHEISAAVSLLTDPLFVNELWPVMYLNGTIIDMEDLGWVQDAAAGTINTSAYGNVQGILRFEYKS